MLKDPSRGCFESHKGVAILANGPYIVLEDDAVPTSRNDFIYTDNWDIVYLGGFPVWNSRKVAEGLYEGECMGTYAMVVNERAASMIRNLEWRGMPVDVHIASLGLRTAFCHPPFFQQVSTPSDIGKSSFTKSQVFAHMLEYSNIIWRKIVLNKVLILIFSLLIINALQN